MALVIIGLFAGTSVLFGLMRLDAANESQARRSLVLWLVANTASAMAGFTLAVLFARAASRSLGALASAVDAVAAGDLDHRITCERRDEIGDLAEAFNRMARSLQDARSAREADEARLRRFSEVVQRSQDFLNNLVESLPQFIDQKDLDGRFLFVTESVCRRLGRTREEVLGLTDADFHPEPIAAQRRERERQVVSKGGAVETLECLDDGAGGSLWLKVVTMPLRDESGEPRGTQSVYWDVTELKRAEEALVAAQGQLVAASRIAGMAEIATGVLHNVGNVLNSVNVSATLIRDRTKRSRVPNLAKLAGLLEEHQHDLARYLTEDPKGRQVPSYLTTLAAHLEEERQDLLVELKGLMDSVDHVKHIVAMQQAYAKAGGVVESLSLAELIEDALRLNNSRLVKDAVEVVRVFQEAPRVLVDRHKTLQILVNLVTNATHALEEGAPEKRRLIVGIAWNGSDRVRLIVRDNGKGIAPENLDRIFQHGFTTRKDGHGFGLHSGALAAREMGGSLAVHSDGPGNGAVFVLELPTAAEGADRDKAILPPGQAQAA
jgi:PAS domain S-box-containing protein